MTPATRDAARETRVTRANPVTVVLVALVRAYQLVVSPWIAPRCKYYPSCSAYAVQALQVHGPVKGVGLAVWRLLRCNPWSLGGVDHVPPRSGSPPDSPAPPAGDGPRVAAAPGSRPAVDHLTAES